MGAASRPAVSSTEFVPVRNASRMSRVSLLTRDQPRASQMASSWSLSSITVLSVCWTVGSLRGMARVSFAGSYTYCACSGAMLLVFPSESLLSGGECGVWMGRD
jgi:hypothetical protein